MTPRQRVELGAQALDIFLGPSWFRTENVALGEVAQAVVEGELDTVLFEGDYVGLTETLQAKGFVAPEMMLDDFEVDGEQLGFYGRESEADELTEAWKEAIRTRRYNRPKRRRVSAVTAKETRSLGVSVAV